MKAPRNPNYCATVVSVRHLVPLDNCDNLMGFVVFGSQAIVTKDTEINVLGVIFPAEVQLSEEYCRENNLYRHSNLNKDPEARGYLEDNRRVRAIKLRGHRSDALFMPLDSLAFTGFDLTTLKEGDEFDYLNGIEICHKYEPTIRSGARSNVQQPARLSNKVFPQHLDSENYFRNVHKLNLKEFVVVTQKLHGISVRIGRTYVERKLNVLERIVRYFGVKVQEVEFDNVYGSRRVIKDSNNPHHFYDDDIWTEEGKKLDDLLPNNCIVYGEIIGWASTNSPIQKHYTYDCPNGTRSLYIYRVAFVNDQGFIVDLSWDALREFCIQRDLKHVPELWRGRLEDLEIDQFINVKFQDRYSDVVPLSPESPCDEGVCVRIEGMNLKIYKAKSPVFLQYETKQLDTGEKNFEN